MPTYYTKSGNIIRNNEAYARTWAPMFDYKGNNINKTNTIYRANLSYGKKYIGKTYSVTNVNPGAGYAVNDTITIAGTSLGGTSPANDIVITVTSNSDDSTNKTLDKQKGTGVDEVNGEKTNQV